MRILVATKNRGKLRELNDVLAGMDVELCDLSAVGDLPDVEEDGATFADNARKKALHYHSLTGLATIADDSGLEVAALGGRPGVFSARYAPTDEMRIAKLLKEIEESGMEEAREARFLCALCLVTSAGELVEVEGEVNGLIAHTPAGSGGFGYDPIFFYPPLNRTFAELAAEEKNQVSHRAAALSKLGKLLPSISL